jgi:nitrite reductase (NADH) large subunit
VDEQSGIKLGGVVRKQIVVVGNGMVGHRFCEKLVEQSAFASFDVTVLGEEPRAAYDRVHLTEFFSGRSAEALSLVDGDFYSRNGIDLRLAEPVARIDRENRRVVCESGQGFPYDALVLATGSAPFVPPIPGGELPGVFVYRTIEDLEAIRGWADESKRAAVIGGGLLGLEAAKAVVDMGLETHVVEFADRLMPRQVDAAGGAILARSIESIGVKLHLNARTEAVVGEERIEGLRFADQTTLDVDLLIISAGIRPRDELARACDVEVGERGGILVDDSLATSDPTIYAIGEVALHEGMIYGLVAPGYEMAEVLAKRLAGENAHFQGADLSTKLKLLGIDVASFGEAFADADNEGARSVIFEDSTRGVYQKLVVNAESDRLLGGIMVGDADAYLALSTRVKQGGALAAPAHTLLVGAGASQEGGADTLEDDAQICSCNNVSKADILSAIRGECLGTLAETKRCTKAGTGCGGCVPLVSELFEAELARSGIEIDRSLCEHFSYTRDELFRIVKLGRIESFDALLASHGAGSGCEVCRPAVASILASSWNDLVANHQNIQDTNDKFLGNIQRGGTYSVIPRVPGGEITADKLIAIGEVAKQYDLYCKITGGQRIDLLGARVEQLPAIWKSLVAAGFESGHAYGKALRTVKSCVGSTWCRFGVQDSTRFAIEIEERYRGLRAPHKLKSAVSGCIRECAEAQSKDFGIIATEQGWNLYVAGNGGSNPRHADLLAAEIDDATLIRYVDRFLMYYIQTAKPLQRTARWLEELEGGIEYLKSVVVDDALGICAQLEADMQQLVDTYACEWKAVVDSPALQARYRHFADSDAPDISLPMIEERRQKRPADWPSDEPLAPTSSMPPEQEWSWVPLCEKSAIPADSGSAIAYGDTQIAVFNFAGRGEWYATQNLCPHRKEMILARGLLGSQGEEPKVACPFHKKTFSLETGKGLSDPQYSIRSFPVEARGDTVFVKLPPAKRLAAALGCPGKNT